MELKRTDEFRQDAVRIALTSGLITERQPLRERQVKHLGMRKYQVERHVLTTGAE
ncbi:MAG: hypothetical protein ABJH20_01565 [Rhizobiaceae bacterium]